MIGILKGTGADRTFRAASISAIALLTLFFVGILVSMLAYTSWNALISAIFSNEILFAIRLSIATATVATVISMLIAIPVAYGMSRMEFLGKDVVDSLLDLPIVTSPIALGAALLVFFNTPLGSGINNHVLRFVFSVPGIVLAQVTVVSALAVRLLKSTFDGIDPRYEHVGRTLGCSKPQVFRRVALPLAREGLIAAAILTWARALGEFGATVTLAGATSFKTETLPTAIFLSLASANVGKAVAVIFILIIIALIALLAIRKTTRRRYAL